MKLSSNLIEDLLNLAFSNKHIFTLLLANLKDQYIHDDDARLIWQEMKRYFHQYDKLPSNGYISQTISNNNKKGKLDGAIDILISIKNTPLPDENAALKALEKYIKQNIFVETYDQMGDEYNKNNKEKAFQIFIEKSKLFNEFTLEDGGFEAIFGDFEERSNERILRQFSNEIQQIPTGWDFIDNTTEGGLWTGETELWLGDSGIGKSKLLVSRGISSSRLGKKVLHVQAEGTRNQCLDNYDACWTGFRYLDLKMGMMDEIKLKNRVKLAEKLLANNKGEILVKVVNKFGGATLSDLRKWVMEAIKQMGGLDHLIVDYLELFGVGDGKKYDFEGGDRTQMTKLARGFKDICVEFNLLGTTVAQSNSIATEILKQPDFVMTRYNIGKHKRFVEPFSYFYTINQTPDERKDGVVRIFEDKLREHPAGKTHLIAQSLSNSRFYDRKRTVEMREKFGYYEEDDEE